MRFSGEFLGLCVTCNNAGFCVYRKRRGSDAIYCEMFDGQPAPNSDGDDSDTTNKPVTAMSPDRGNHIGLCAHCAHRDVCGLPRPSSGVWHCEEYA